MRASCTHSARLSERLRCSSCFKCHSQLPLTASITRQASASHLKHSDLGGWRLAGAHKAIHLAQVGSGLLKCACLAKHLHPLNQAGQQLLSASVGIVMLPIATHLWITPHRYITRPTMIGISLGKINSIGACEHVCRCNDGAVGPPTEK